MKLPNDEIVHYKSNDGVNVIIERTELVRCKDCKWCEERRTANYLPFYYCLRIDSSVKDDDYCSYGERKDDETD